MSAKTLFIVLITAAATTVLVSNTGEMEIWLFGTYHFSKLAVMATLLITGFILGLLVRGSSRKQKEYVSDATDQDSEQDETAPYLKKQSTLSDEDRDYIS